MKSIIFLLIVLVLSCTHKNINEKLGGIDLGILSKELTIEKSVGLEPLETAKGYSMRICKMETMGPDTSANDFLVEIKFIHQSSFVKNSAPINFSIWKLKNNKVLSFKKFSLEYDGQKEFMFVLDSLKPQFQNGLDCKDLFDGKEHFVLRFFYKYYNQYYFNNSCDNKISKQGRFVSYISRLVKEKADIVF